MTFGPSMGTNRFHHRCSRFHSLYSSIEESFREKFNVSDAFEIYLIGGSGTLGLETCLWSARHLLVRIYNTHQEFGNRLLSLWKAHSTGYAGQDKRRLGVYVQYETSISEVFTGKVEGDAILVDAVSAFPYYPIPDHADLWVTVSGKQLGAFPGVSIVVCHKRLWERGFLDNCVENYSILNLSRYRLFSDRKECPTTPPISVLESLANSLSVFSVDKLREEIDEKRKSIISNLGSASLFDSQGPVVTFPSGYVSDRLIDLFGLYKTGEGKAQTFLWNATADRLASFLQEVRREKWLR